MVIGIHRYFSFVARDLHIIHVLHRWHRFENAKVPGVEPMELSSARGIPRGAWATTSVSRIA